jgi:hypothetical protein
MHECILYKCDIDQSTIDFMAAKTYNYVRAGWLKPKASTGSHGNSNIKLPKAIIVFG